jgi:hypothetical protein
LPERCETCTGYAPQKAWRRPGRRRTLLGGYAAALKEFGDDLQADVIIIEAGDTLDRVESAYGRRLVADGRFTFLVELITEHARWFDVVFIFSDNGDGLVLLIEQDAATDAHFLAACRHALATV